MDGARRLGRLARLLSITFIILGIVIIIVAVTVNFTGEAQGHEAERSRGWGSGEGAAVSFHFSQDHLGEGFSDSSSAWTSGSIGTSGEWALA